MCAEKEANPHAGCLCPAGALQEAPREQPGRGANQSPISKVEPAHYPALPMAEEMGAHHRAVGVAEEPSSTTLQPREQPQQEARVQRDGRGRWWRPEAQGHSWWREGAGGGHCPAGAGAAQTDNRRHCEDSPAPRARPRPGIPVSSSPSQSGEAQACPHGSQDHRLFTNGAWSPS